MASSQLAMSPALLEGNRILRLLPLDEAQRIVRAAEPVDLGFKEPIYRNGKAIEHVYFPLTAVVSLIMDTQEGLSVEASTVGREGMVGLAAFLGDSPSPWRALCQIQGRALRIRAREFIEEVRLANTFSLVLLRYTNAIVGQIAQTAACNRAHPLEERMCRWLLTTHDRVDSDDIPLTQEFLGQMLGVRRPSVSLAGSMLQKAGLIHYSRGRVRILNRGGLEASSCECYEVVRNQYEQALKM